jgi:hypothetical protein
MPFFVVLCEPNKRKKVKMKLKHEQRMITWQMNDKSQPLRYIVDCSRSKESEMERFMKDTDLINEYKDEPLVLREIMGQVEYSISCEQWCYHEEKEHGGLREVMNEKVDLW